MTRPALMPSDWRLGRRHDSTRSNSQTLACSTPVTTTALGLVCPGRRASRLSKRHTMTRPAPLAGSTPWPPPPSDWPAWGNVLTAYF